MAKIDIVNQSLMALGLDIIDSLDDSTQEAQYTNMYFDNALGQVTESYSWSFLIKTQILNQVQLNEKYNYNYAFQIPSDCYKIRSAFVGPNAQIKTTTIIGYDICYYNQYTVKGSLLYANINNIFLEYYKYLSSDAELENTSVKFKNAISSKLASILAPKFNPSLIPAMHDQYEADLYTAKNLDTMNKKTHGFDYENSFYMKLQRV